MVGQDCPICQEEITEDKGVEPWNCTHWIHEECSDDLYGNLRSQFRNEEPKDRFICPLCRAKFNDEINPSQVELAPEPTTEPTSTQRP